MDIRYFKFGKKAKQRKFYFLLLAGFYFLLNFWGCHQGNETLKQFPSPQKTEADSFIFKYRMQAFGHTPEGRQAAYGQKLVNETYKYFFKDGHKIGNQLSCSNCHLDGGTRPYAIPFIGLKQVFPVYMGRVDKVASLEDRINGCFERSMNGEAIPVDSKEMKAIVAYINFLSRDVRNRGRMKGQGLISFIPPNRRADTVKGRVVFREKCQNCHQKNGEGIKLSRGFGYTYPPLWGPASFNDGAGMGRILTAARFIKANMPLGTTYKNPQLTDAEAYDVAAYINSFPRPLKSGLSRDYPNLKKKPKDCPYPPYPDKIPQIQHKYGPFNFKD